MFELKLNNKTISLKWGTWAMREFCLTYNVTIDRYFEMLSQSQFDLNMIIKLFYIGYKAACASKKEEEIYNEVDVCEWLDEIGSIFVSEGQLVEYIKYILLTTNVDVSTPKDKEKKKASKV